MRNLLVILCVLLLSCTGNIVFQERAEIQDMAWAFDYPLSFDFQIQDTSLSYDMFLDIEHSRNFEYQNLYTGLRTISPSGDTTFQRFSIDLSDEFGQWLGTCKGNECSHQVLIKSASKYSGAGDYMIILDQYSRSTVLQGIKSIGLTLALNED